MGSKPEMGMGEGYRSEDNEFGRAHSRGMFVEGDTRGFVSPEEIPDQQEGSGDPLHALIREEEEVKGIEDLDLGYDKREEDKDDASDESDDWDPMVLQDHRGMPGWEPVSGEESVSMNGVQQRESMAPKNIKRILERAGMKTLRQKGKEIAKEQKPRYLEDGEAVRDAKRQNLH